MDITKIIDQLSDSLQPFSVTLDGKPIPQDHYIVPWRLLEYNQLDEINLFMGQGVVGYWTESIYGYELCLHQCLITTDFAAAITLAISTLYRIYHSKDMSPINIMEYLDDKKTNFEAFGRAGELEEGV